MCQQCQQRDAQDRAFWVIVRRSLLMLVKAIESRHAIGK